MSRSVDKKSDTNNKNNGIWYMVLSVLTLLVAVLGATLAYKIVTGYKKNDVVVRAGTLSIKYIDGKVVNNPSLNPRVRPVSINDTINTYKKEFVVKSTGSLNQDLTIYFDVSKNEFSDNSLAYLLYEEEFLVDEGYVNGVGKVKLASGRNLKSGKKKKYTFMVYLLENGKLQDSEKDKSLSGSFVIDAIQYVNK